MTARELFEKHCAEPSLDWSDVANKRSQRRDLHAFLLLDELFPSSAGMDLVCSAEHDQIWFDFDEQDLDGHITEDQIKELAECGVFFDSDAELLSMHV